MGDETERQRTVRQRALRIAMISFVVGTLFFACGGIVLADQALRGAFVSWQKVDPPAGRPAALRRGESGEVLLEAADGQLYEWMRYGSPPWEVVAEPSGYAPFWGQCQAEANDYFVVSTPPDKVRQRVEGTCPGPETAYHYEVVLLENGELWSWTSSSMHTILVSLYKGVIAVAGIGVSLFLGGLAYVLGSISWQRGG